MPQFMRDDIASDVRQRHRRAVRITDHRHRTLPIWQAPDMRNELGVREHDHDLANLACLIGSAQRDLPQPESTADPGKQLIPMCHPRTNEGYACVVGLSNDDDRGDLGQRNAVAAAGWA